MSSRKLMSIFALLTALVCLVRTRGENITCGFHYEKDPFAKPNSSTNSAETNAYIGQFPHQVLVKTSVLSHNNGIESYYCSGALIGERLVLTALSCIRRFHCRRDISEQDIEPKIATIHSIGSLVFMKGLRRNISRYITHQNVNCKDDIPKHDIALLVIGEISVNFVKTTSHGVINSVCIPEKYERLGDSSLACNWGLDKSNTNNNLQTAPVEQIHCDQSETKFCAKYKDINSAKILCSGNNDILVRAKNSAWELIGISSAMNLREKCTNSKTVIYTNVSFYTDWIKSFMKMADEGRLDAYDGRDVHKFSKKYIFSIN